MAFGIFLDCCRFLKGRPRNYNTYLDQAVHCILIARTSFILILPLGFYVGLGLVGLVSLFHVSTIWMNNGTCFGILDQS